jgi:hypothetical protein
MSFHGRLALREWHSLNPDRFPGVPGWSENVDWQTPDEQDAHSQLQAIDQKRELILTELDAQRAAVERQLADARGHADRYERTLLTGQSDELVSAVFKPW